jgi:hypothetical protein
VRWHGLRRCYAKLPLLLLLAGGAAGGLQCLTGFCQLPTITVLSKAYARALRKLLLLLLRRAEVDRRSCLAVLPWLRVCISWDSGPSPTPAGLPAWSWSRSAVSSAGGLRLSPREAVLLLLLLLLLLMGFSGRCCSTCSASLSRLLLLGCSSWMNTLQRHRVSVRNWFLAGGGGRRGGAGSACCSPMHIIV